MHLKVEVLGPRDLQRTAEFAQAIEAENRARQRKDKQGFEADAALSLARRVSGYRGECALALALGLVWQPRDSFRTRPDVGPYECRTRTRDDPFLIITPDDDLTRRYVLVVESCPRYLIYGWYLAGAAHRPEWWQVRRKNGGAWYVPAVHLHPIPGIHRSPLVAF